MNKVSDVLNTKLEQFENVVIPETSNKNFLTLVQNLDKDVHVLEKNDMHSIRAILDTQSMMKSERQKLYAALDTMTSVKMAAIAGNQRKRFIDCLFKKHPLKNAVFLDDSVFSGYTFAAALSAIEYPTTANIVLFSK